MKIKGFNENEISGDNKEALQSETWQKVRETLKEENSFTTNSAVEEAEKMKQAAKEKLEKEMREAADRKFVEPVIEYLLKRCAEDEGLAEDVLQEHKTWQKCFDYIYNQANKQSKGNYTFVREDIVYEWAEDYYHKDDKAEEEKKAKKEEERNASQASQKKAAESKKAAEKSKGKETAEVSPPVKEKKEEKVKEQPKPKKSGSDIEGQLDMFSLMGM